MKIIAAVFLLISSGTCIAQNPVNVNFILVVDDEIVVNGVSDVHLIDTHGTKYQVTYFPGRLVFDKKVFDSMSLSGDGLVLAFDFYQQMGSKHVLCNYTLPIAKQCLTWEFFILKVYNLDKKKYKRRFDPLDAKRNYTFEYIYPGGEMLRTKEQ